MYGYGNRRRRYNSYPRRSNGYGRRRKYNSYPRRRRY